jgi:hypothetical protein
VNRLVVGELGLVTLGDVGLGAVNDGLGDVGLGAVNDGLGDVKWRTRGWLGVGDGRLVEGEKP